MAEDLYQTLGVTRDASKDDIQKAYRKLARKHHPDLNQNDKKAQEKFKRVQEAYDVLSNDEKRAAYNRYGADFERIRTSGYSPGSAGGGSFEGLDLEQIFGGARGGSGAGFENGFSDFFEQLMGARGGGRTAGRSSRRAAPAPTQGENVRHELKIPLQKAILGGATEFYVHTASGAHKLSVNIPPGIESGAKLKLRGKGEPSTTGGPPGDLILIIHVLEDHHFRRQGRNLEMTLPVTLREAALGAKIDVPTPRSTITLSIPPCSSSGRKLRIKGQGVPDASGESGDLIVQIQIMLPKHLDEEAKQAIEAIDQAHPIEPRK
ncbi:MAG: DnaJ C-terminal domain-containing protein [Planctomycetaceae bacterium]